MVLFFPKNSKYLPILDILKVHKRIKDSKKNENPMAIITNLFQDYNI
jgi:hypothetical protein